MTVLRVPRCDAIRDVSGNLTFQIQPEPGWANTGTAPVQQVALDTIRLAGTVPGEFFPTGGGPRSDVSLRLDGVLNTTNRAAELTLLAGGVGGQLYTFVAAPADGATANEAQARIVAQQAADALVAEDWAALYQLAPGGLTANVTQAEFVSAMQAQAAPNILRVTLDGLGQKRGTGDTIYFEQPVTITEQLADGSTRATATKLFLIWENNQWRALGTDKPPA